ncbi:tRNA-dihydrouridine synthase 3 [Lodderomyces elongisporus]|uniref:tRNA-dihydrouridine synthase 3 n=1 Tax=Lodderomyces elongisporus TaxID=36914 RepID=UPI00292584F2|nr:tRNA-dihydrouridine synthase 3 [Lodderomyces elongisporus]WLF77019.1 tRNA-dihydrouridine synthase 3 [Lodderomyces elongisporus]
MTVQEKRPLDEANVHGDECKKPNTQPYVKGMAAIKPEYLAPISSNVLQVVEYDDDEAESGGRETSDASGNNSNNNKGKKGKNGKKGRGQNHNRDLKQKGDAVRLCMVMIDPEDDDTKCAAGGAENCKYSHNIEEYLAAKSDDIEGTCPVYEALGYCPSGLKCRWLHSHYNKETKKLIKDLEKLEREKPKNHEVNIIDRESKVALQRKKFNFDISTPVINFLESRKQKDDGKQNKEEQEASTDGNEKQEERKDNEASYVEQPFKIAEKKKINLRRAKIVSPLTTVGNLPYRRLMKTLGADVTYSEMALAVPLSQGHRPEWALPKAHVTEYPGFGVQIASSKHWAAAKAAEALYKTTSHVSEINLNCGCPIDLLFKQGQGSALLDSPPRLIRIVKAMNASSGDIPVTIKIRTGVKENKNTAVHLVNRVLEETQVAAITLHGRSRQQRYTKEADWDYIEEVGKVVKTWNEKREDEDKEGRDTNPTWFVGNGDVYSHEDWYNGVNREGVDSVMVARGALIKPWIFEEVEAQQYLDKSSTERLAMLEKYAKYAVEHWGSDEYGVSNARRFMCEFLSFTHRYVPVGILERLPAKLNERPPKWIGRNDLETLLGSSDYKDWIKITEMFLGKAGDDFSFIPKHKSNSYEN